MKYLVVIAVLFALLWPSPADAQQEDEPGWDCVRQGNHLCGGLLNGGRAGYNAYQPGSFPTPNTWRWTVKYQDRKGRDRVRVHNSVDQWDVFTPRGTYLRTVTRTPEGREVTRYRRGIPYVPDQRGWSRVTHRVNGTVVRSGSTAWITSSPRPRTLLVQLFTIWDGEGTSNATYWTETYVFAADGTLTEAWGGNADNSFLWDIIYDREFTP